MSYKNNENGLDIIYIWNEELEEKYGAGITLSGKYEIFFIPVLSELSVKMNKSYVSGIWGANIIDCYAIVGENGSGKTMLVNDIMVVLEKIKKRYASGIMVFEKTETEELLIYSDEDIGYYVENVKFKKLKDKKELDGIMDNYKVAYFHNILNEYDYMQNYRCDYDYSIGYQMHKNSKRRYEMHQAALSENTVTSYFTHQDFKIIEFLYEYEQMNLDKNKLEYPIPKEIEIGIADQGFYEKNLFRELEKDGDVDKKSVRDFQTTLKRFENIGGKGWINATLKALLLNCMNRWCIAHVIPGEVLCTWQRFFEACDLLRDKSLDIGNIFQQMIQILENLKNDLGNDIYYQEVKAFLDWLKNNVDSIKKYEIYGRKLQIIVNQNTKNFITELIEQYDRLSFEFSFYDFSFGVSTGEYSFLSTFTNIYSIYRESQKVRNSHEAGTTKNILLIFDEADATLHPKWQREYMKVLTDFCKQILKDMAVKIIITTHSPIMLSDFPGNSVLYLQKEAGHIRLQTMCQRKTFGSDIHALFLDSFFLEQSGIMGAFAEEKINEISEKLLEKKVKDQYEQKQIEKIIDYIGEGIVRSKLMQLISKNDDLMPVDIGYKGRNVMESAVQELKGQKQQLEQLIYYLEEMLND